MSEYTEIIEVPDQDYEKISKKLGVTNNAKLIKALVAELKLVSPLKVLDTGCGCGGHAWYMAAITGCQVFGVDRSRAMLLRAKKFIPVIQADALNIPLTSSLFDRIYAVNLLQLLSDRLSFFHEVNRLLKHSGILALPITTHSQIKRRFLNRFFPNLASIECRRYPTITTIQTELLKSGFKRVWTRPLDLGYFHVDRAYVERQRSYIFSGLLLLDQYEREAGLKALEKAVEVWEKSGTVPIINWKRTLLLSKKGQKEQGK